MRHEYENAPRFVYGRLGPKVCTFGPNQGDIAGDCHMAYKTTPGSEGDCFYVQAVPDGVKGFCYFRAIWDGLRMLFDAQLDTVGEAHINDDVFRRFPFNIKE